MPLLPVGETRAAQVLTMLTQASDADTPSGSVSTLSDTYHAGVSAKDEHARVSPLVITMDDDALPPTSHTSAAAVVRDAGSGRAPRRAAPATRDEGACASSSAAASGSDHPVVTSEKKSKRAMPLEGVALSTPPRGGLCANRKGERAEALVKRAIVSPGV